MDGERKGLDGGEGRIGGQVRDCPRLHHLVRKDDEAAQSKDAGAREGLHTSCVRVFLHWMQLVEVGRAIRRRSSMGCLQYLQLP